MSGPPWTVGQHVEFSTFDHPDGDIRDLDGTRGIVLQVPKPGAEHDDVLVSSVYGQRWFDPYSLVSA